MVERAAADWFAGLRPGKIETDRHTLTELQLGWSMGRQHAHNYCITANCRMRRPKSQVIISILVVSMFVNKPTRLADCYTIFSCFVLTLWPLDLYIPKGRWIMNDSKRTMTLNLTEVEMQVLEELAKRKDLNKTAVVRQAIRLFQMVDARLALGEKLIFEDEKSQKKAELLFL